MRKQEFLDALKAELSGLPGQDVQERLDFYSEMIDDSIEEGLSEEEAVSKIGSACEIASQIIADIPFTRIAKERIKPKKQLRAWEILLLILGSPIWLSLAVAVFAVIFSLYVSLWAVIISLWAVFVSLVCSAIGVIVAGIVFALFGNAITGIAMIGVSISCLGLSIFLFFGCKAAGKGAFTLAKKAALGIKKAFVVKEEAK